MYIPLEKPNQFVIEHSSPLELKLADLEKRANRTLQKQFKHANRMRNSEAVLTARRAIATLHEMLMREAHEYADLCL